MNHIEKYIIASLILFFTDFAYIQFVKNHFNEQVMLVQKNFMKINLVAVILCYILLTVGFYYFSVMRRFTHMETFFLGIFIYGVYETTNWALFVDWKLSTVLMDTLWGGTLFVLAKTIYEFVMKKN